MVKKKQPAKKEAVRLAADTNGSARADESPEQNDAKYRTLFEAIADAAFCIDQQTGNILDVNSAATRIYGFTHEEFLKLKKIDISAEIEQTARATHEMAPWIAVRYHKRKDGSIFPVEITANTCEIQGRTLIICTARDITGRKQAEEALTRSEDRYRTILENMQDSYIEVDLAGNFTFINEATCRNLGYTMEELTGQNFSILSPGQDELQAIFAAYNKVYKTGEPHKGFAFKVRRKDGTTGYTETSISILKNEQGRNIGFRSVGRDVTERKRVEDALKDSEQKYRLLAEHTTDTVWLMDMNLKTTYQNPSVQNTRGFTPQEIMEMPLEQTLTPESLKIASELASQEIPRVEADPDYNPIHILELEYYRKDGATVWAEIKFSIIRDGNGKAVSILGEGRDITDRKRAEDAVRESEGRFKSIIEHVNDIFYIQNAEREILYISPQVEQMLGYTLEEMQNGWQNYLTDNPMNLAGPEKSRMAITTGEKQGPYLLEFIRSDGTKRLAEINESPLKNDKGEVTGIVGAARDITERKRIESALKESEEKYRTVVENAMEAITISVDGMIKFANSRAAKLGGYSLEELTSGSFLKFVHPDDHQMVTNNYLMHLQGTDVPNKYSFRIICKPGDIKWVDVTGALITWKGKPAILNFLNDITDRKRLEEEQQRVEKLESVGVLAGGIAHDFNNILTAILGNISLAGMEAQEGSELHGSLEEAQKAVMRAKDLTKQLLTFSRGGAPVMKLSSLTELLKDTSDFALRGSNVKCEFSIPDDLWHAEIDAGQVSQVIHNLVINAQQAMPEGGTIELTAQNITLSETRRLGKGLPLKKGNYVRIAVADHGSGIPAQHMDRIFDPFFTTKQKGSGLGLATSFSIARQHGGHLSAVSTPNSGSTFYLYLPASRAKSTPRRDNKMETKPAGKARILVMDDEKGVREVAGRMLKHIGYQDIEFAADGAEAVSLYKAAMESGRPFTVAILDLTIPGGMGGKMTIKKLRKIDPGVKAIVSSGYVDDSVIAKYKEYGFSGMVAKPYTIAELGKALQDVIG